MTSTSTTSFKSLFRSRERNHSPQIKQIVRTFSDKYLEEEPDDDLAQSLALKESEDRCAEEAEINSKAEWQQLFLPTKEEQRINKNDEAELDKISKKLAKQWLDFKHLLPEGHSAREKDTPPPIYELLEAVETANLTWQQNREQTNSGKAKQRFGKLCKSLDSHKEMMAVIPQGDKYVSLLTGTFSAIVKATVNHEDIAKEIPSVLEDLSEDISFWQRTTQHHRENEQIKGLVVRLYVAIFDLLLGIMGWYETSWKRFKTAFSNKSLDTIIISRKKTMDEIGKKIVREAELATRDAARENGENFSKFLSSLSSDLAIDVQTTARDLCASSLFLLQQQDQQQKSQQLLTVGDGIQRSSSAASVRTIESFEMTTHYHEAIINFKRCQQGDLIESLIQQTSDLQLNLNIFQEIEKLWLSENKSRVLWIYGPSAVSKPSRYTLTSAFLVKLAYEFDVPVITYFCDEISISTSSREKTSCVQKLVYSLISQLAEFPGFKNIDSDAQIASSPFASLTSATPALPEAVNLLRNTLAATPYDIFCVIDNIQDLLYKLPQPNKLLLSEVITMLSPSTDVNDRRHSSAKFIKTFFTTDGYTPLLAVLPPENRLDALDFESEGQLGIEPDTLLVSMLG